MMFAKSFQSKNMLEIRQPSSRIPAIKMTHVFFLERLRRFHKTPLGWIPLTIFEVVATQIFGEMCSPPENWGFMIQFDERASFLKGVETQPPTTFVLGGHRTWGPCELHPRWCGLGNFVWPKKTRTSSASRSPGPHDVGSPACFPGLNRLGNFFEMKKLLLMATRIPANRMGFIQPAVNNGISTTNLN